jgi:SAM-dependent MidA family methyltransferase
VPAGLPPPDNAAAGRAAALLGVIGEAIRQAGGALPLARYLELALYAPDLGYYTGPEPKLGPAGDFVTAPEVSTLFGRCVARQCAEVLGRLGGGEVLELGAGTGALAAQVLATLEDLGQPPVQYRILEVSGDLRGRQEETLAARVPRLARRVEWLDCLPTDGLQGVVLANEVVDAIPFHRVCRGPEGFQELYVTVTGNRLGWRLGPTSGAAVDRSLAAVEADLGAPLAEGYVTEVAPAREAWVRTVGGVLERGVALVIDYGYPRREYYHPQRVTGTLSCSYRHRSHPDPLALTGLQDVTAHVDFTGLAQAAVDAGLRVAGFASQAEFLLGTGLLEDLSASDPQGWDHLARASAARRLTLPGLMGEAYKVLALARGLAGPLRGFGVRDRRDWL